MQAQEAPVQYSLFDFGDAADCPSSSREDLMGFLHCFEAAQEQPRMRILRYEQQEDYLQIVLLEGLWRSYTPSMQWELLCHLCKRQKAQNDLLEQWEQEDLLLPLMKHWAQAVLDAAPVEERLFTY